MFFKAELIGLTVSTFIGPMALNQDIRVSQNTIYELSTGKMFNVLDVNPSNYLQKRIKFYPLH